MIPIYRDCCTRIGKVFVFQGSSRLWNPAYSPQCHNTFAP